MPPTLADQDLPVTSCFFVWEMLVHSIIIWGSVDEDQRACIIETLMSILNLVVATNMALSFSFLLPVAPLFHFIWRRGWQMVSLGVTIFRSVCPYNCLILRKRIIQTGCYKDWWINSFLLFLELLNSASSSFSPKYTVFLCHGEQRSVRILCKCGSMPLGHSDATPWWHI